MNLLIFLGPSTWAQWKKFWNFLTWVCILCTVDYSLEFCFKLHLKILLHICYLIKQILFDQRIIQGCCHRGWWWWWWFCSTAELFLPINMYKKSHEGSFSQKISWTIHLNTKTCQNAEAVLEFSRFPLDGRNPLSISQWHQAKKLQLFQTYMFACGSCTCIKKWQRPDTQP